MEGDEKVEITGQIPETGGFSDNQEMYENQRSRKEKTITALVLVVAIVVVLGTVFTYAQGIANPDWLNLGGDKECKDGSCDTGLSGETPDLAKDTDGDSISDFEELNVYKTSPFLEDSDSDGMNDDQEILAGRDPNCPGTESCSAVAGSPTSGTIVPALGATPGGDSDLHNQIISGQATPEVIRALLVQGGISASDLAQISDEDLLDFYREYLASGSDDSQGGSSSGVDVGSLNFSSVEDLQALSGAQIRALLIQEGAPASILDQMSDEDLKNIFLSQLEAKMSN